MNVESYRRKAAQKGQRIKPTHENGRHQRRQRSLIDAPRQSTATKPLARDKLISQSQPVAAKD